MRCLIFRIVVIFCLATFAGNFEITAANQYASAWSPPVTKTTMPKNENPSQSQGIISESNSDKKNKTTDEGKSQAEQIQQEEKFLPVQEKKDEEIFIENPVVLTMAAVIVILSVVIIFLILKNRQNSAVKNSANNFDEKNFDNRISNAAPVFHIGNFHNIGCREEQQDSFCISDIGDINSLREKGIMAVVADGMGGMEGGAAISQLVADTFRKSYAKNSKFEPSEFLYNTAKEAERIVDNYKRKTGLNGGSTVVAVIIKERMLNILSVGDSRIYLLRQGKLEQLNHEHTFGAFLKEQADRGEVPPEEPYINPKRNALTAYIGMGSLKKADRGNPVLLFPGDKILLCSDGVFNALSNDALIAAMSKDALSSAEKLERSVLAQGIPTQDNFTGVILEYVA